MIEPKRIVRTDAREVHMVGEYVAVCFNLGSQLQTVMIDGEQYRRPVKKREGAASAYIDFVELREDGAEVWEDDESPADGGFGTGTARQFAHELLLACSYLEQLRKGEQS